MKPAPFRYVVPDTVEEALSVLNEHGADAKVLAGRAEPGRPTSRITYRCSLRQSPSSVIPRSGAVARLLGRLLTPIPRLRFRPS